MAIKYSSIGGGSGTGFNVQIGSQYSYATFTQAQPAGAYTIKSSNNYTNWDVYLLDASNNLVAYTGSASIAPTTAFSAIVVVNGTLNDILQFSFQSTVFSTATTSQTKAGPFITAFGSSVIPSVNSAVTITGGNFAVGITATFTGTDSVVRTCKSVVYNSNTSISVVRPDVLPVTYAPYTLTLTNPGVNNPTTSGKNLLTGLTVGNAPVWSTATSLAAADPSTAYSATVVATDVEGAVTYSYVSGTLPTGLSFNTGTGVISGTYSGSTNGTASYTIRATDNGGNFTDRTFTIGFTSVSGGTLTSDATYYYRVFTGNGTLTSATSLSLDVLMVAGGGGGGGLTVGGGGGAGGVLASASTQTYAAGSYTIAVGGGGTGSINSGTHATNGLPTTISSSGFTTLTANGGGYGGDYTGSGTGFYVGGNGGSGGGGGSSSFAGGSANQGSVTGYTGYGNNGGASSSSQWHGGGGGGAGAVGQTNSGPGGNGGNGSTIWSSWLSSINASNILTGVSGWSSATSGGYIAGGGGGCGGYDGLPGGTGGAGGGGTGGKDTTIAPTAGTTNTGGGGGGARDAVYSAGAAGAPGGSGIVIVRYTRASVGG
jgi:hypothetical protein